MKRTLRIKIVSMLTAAVVWLCMVTPGVMAVPEKSDINVITLVKEASNGGYADEYFVDENGNTVSFPQLSMSEDTGKLDTPPAEYDARDYGCITSVKDQGDSNCCWAFAATGAIESSMVKNSYEALGNADYSEAHLIWFAGKERTTDTSDPTYGDGEDVTSPFETGGNWRDATFTYARGSGAELEANKPFYDDSENFGLMEYTEADRYASYSRLMDTSILAETHAAIDAQVVKSSIMNGGAVAGSFYSLSARYTYGSGYTSYFQTGATSTNHAVMIIGWDDSYPTANFSSTCRPTTNGAWLCKNSWGDNWGDDGCFWLSYAEPSLKNIVSYTAAPADTFDSIYQYDGAGWTQSICVEGYATAKAANIFTASKDEILTHVAFNNSFNASVNYEVSVYLGGTSSTNPASGTKVTGATTTGSVSFTGYHTVAIASPVELTQGQRFSVIVKMTDTTGAKMYIAVEGTDTAVYSSVTGVSFFGIGTSTWYDTSSSLYNNICVKAMTNDYPEEVTVSPAEGSETVIDSEHGYIYGLRTNMTWGEFFDSIEITGNAHMESLGSTFVSTGAEVQVVSDDDNSVINTYTLVVFGDLNSDGLVLITDLTLLKAHIAGSTPINAGSAFEFAIDFMRDELILQTDYTLLKSVIAGSKTIDQTTGTVV